MRRTRRSVRLLLAALSLAMATVAAPLAATSLNPAKAAAAADVSRECIAGSDYAGRGDLTALCVYDDARGNRFARIAYRNPKNSVYVHSSGVSLVRCQAGPKNCSTVAYAYRNDVSLPTNTRLAYSTAKVKAQYGWSYQACGGIHVTNLTTPPQRDWSWSDCTPFIPGAPKITIITG